MSLCSDFLANDRPIMVSYKGELLFPVFVSYPEEKFGGFLAQTDYRDPIIEKEITAHGWMIWPPIRYSYDTHNLDLPMPAPSPPTWMLTKQQCEAAAAKKLAPGQPNEGCSSIEWNWLGTDDQGRDVVARLLYGFRLSVLFELILATISSIVGVAAGAIQGFFGGRVDLIFQRVIEVWSSLPQLYLLIIISSFLTPGFFVLLGILLLFSWVSLVHVVRAEFLRARNFEYVNAARALGLSNFKIIMRPPIAQRNGRDADLPALHSQFVDYDADLARLPWFWIAAGFSFAWRIAVARKVEFAGAMARPHRLRHYRAHAVAARVHWRSGARRLRSAKDVQMTEPDKVKAPLLDVRDLSISFLQGRKETIAVDHVSFSLERGRTLRNRRRVGFGKIDNGAIDRAPAAALGASPLRKHLLRRRGRAENGRASFARDARRQGNHGVPGADDVSQSVAHNRTTDR